MKGILKIVLGMVFIFSLSACVFAQDIEADSRISQVTVYPGDALLTRVAALKLNAGNHKIIFSDVIPDLDENSLRVSGSGSAEVKILEALVKKEFLEEVPAERVKELQDEIQNLKDEKRRLEDNIKIVSEEKQFLDSIRLFSGEQLPKDLITKMPKAQELDEVMKFLDIKLKENYSQIMDTQLKIRDLDKKIEALNRELAQISGAHKKLKRSIAVELEVKKAGQLELSVSYLVRGAAWQPIYDARANFEKSAVELVSYGIIRQKTGEDWQDVEIYLSTAKPAIGGRLPYINPWILRPYQPRSMERRVAAKAAPMTLQTMAFDKEEIASAIGGADELEVYAEAQEKGIAVVYKLSRKADIKSDGSEHKLPISSQTLKAEFEYSSFPRAVLSAYLGSRVTNAPNLQLLAGRVNIFLDEDFVGASSIDNIGPGEEFDLYLGQDENVKVKREQIEKKVDETLIAGIPSPTRRTTFKYKLTLENYKSRKINAKLFEAMPVSEDDRIKTKVLQVNPEPKEKDWKDRKGIWLWELELEPGAKKEIIYTFIIEHPRDLQVEGL
jgi:uncharacterized protein (TIGR02231 family)